MTKPWYVFVLVLVVQGVCLAQTISWQQTSGPSGGYVRALTTDNDGSIFVGTSGGIFKSTNGGDGWALSANGLGSSLVYSLAVSPNGALFAGSFYDGIFRSTDNGSAWAGLGGIFFIVNAIAIDHQGVIFAGDEEGDSKAGNGGTVYRSTNNGTSWTALHNGLPDSPVYQIQIGNDGSIFVGMKDGMFRSTNNGGSWAPVSNGLWITWISDIAVNRLNNHIFVSGSNQSGTSVALFRSTDGGNSFQQLAFPDVHAHTLGVSLEGDVFAATTGFNPSLNYGIFRSTDDGNSFVRVDSMLSVKKFGSANPNKLLAGTNLGVHLSADNGSTWQFKGSGMAGVSANTLASDNDHTTYAGTINGQFRTTDGGTNWVRLEIGLTLRGFGSMAVNSRGDVFGVNDLGKAYRSTDAGSSWSELTNGLPGIAGQGLIFVHGNDMLFLAHPFRGVMRSTDNGDSWLPRNTGMPPNEDVNTFANDQDGNFYAGTFLSGMWKSTDNGELWSRLGAYNGYVHLMAVNRNGDLFWAYSSSLPATVYLYRSTDAGATWVRRDISPSNAGTATALLITPGQDLYVAVSDGTVGGVYRSSDNGDNFAYVSDGLTEKLLTSFGMDGTGHLLAGTTRGVFRTEESVLTTVGGSGEIPASVRLDQNYPNPFNPSTKIRFTLPARSSDAGVGLVSLKVFDMLGREVATLVNEEKPAGTFEVTLHSPNLASGVYYYRLSAGGFVETKKLMVVR